MGNREWGIENRTWYTREGPPAARSALAIPDSPFPIPDDIRRALRAPANRSVPRHAADGDQVLSEGHPGRGRHLRRHWPARLLHPRHFSRVLRARYVGP